MYYQLCTSGTLKCEWKRFLESSVHSSGSPCFCQYVTIEVFKELIKLELPLPNNKKITFFVTESKRNALRYVACYVCQKCKRTSRNQTAKSLAMKT